jgi:hypothetical protein
MISGWRLLRRRARRQRLHALLQAEGCLCGWQVGCGRVSQDAGVARRRDFQFMCRARCVIPQRLDAVLHARVAPEMSRDASVLTVPTLYSGSTQQARGLIRRGTDAAACPWRAPPQL